MDLDERIIAAIIGLVGGLISIAFAAVISSIGYLSRSSLEKKRSARVVLYMLFEIRHVIKSKLSDPKSENQQFITRYKSHLQRSNIEGDFDFLDETLGPIIESGTKSITDISVNGVFERLLEPYEKALEELSQVNPVLAYKLKGLDKYFEIATFISTYLNTIKAASPKNLPKEISDFILKAEKTVKQNLIEELDECIRVVSRKCSKRDRLEAEKLISVTDEEKDAKRYQELDEFFKSFIFKLEQVIERESQNNQTPPIKFNNKEL
ncbi:hypothetical protein [Pseudoalteromonas piscicida]